MASVPLPRLDGVCTMLAETVREWTEHWVEQDRVEERAPLCRLAARRSDTDAGQQLAAALAEVAVPGRLAQVGEWIIECGPAAELFARLAEASPPTATEDDGLLAGRGTDIGHPAQEPQELVKRRACRCRFQSEDVRRLPVANWPQDEWRRLAATFQTVYNQ